MKTLFLSCLAAFAVFTGSARGAFVFTLQQTGANVVLTGTGTIRLGGLSYLGHDYDFGYIHPNAGILVGGPATGVTNTAYTMSAGPASFGLGGPRNATSGTGDMVLVGGQNLELDLPQGYVSGAPLADSAVFANTTLADLGATPGSYTYTWGSGANADFLTVNIVPEPSTLALLGLGVACLLGWSICRVRRA